MAGLSWVIRGPCLWVLILASLIPGSAGHMVDEDSCRDVRQYDDSGTVISYGDYYDVVRDALRETNMITKKATNTMEKVETRQANSFDSQRVKGIFTELQGFYSSPITRQPHWANVATNTQKLYDYLRGRDSRGSVIYCGDAYLDRWYFFQDGTKKKTVPARDKDKVVGYRYWDPLLAAHGEDPWYDLNEESCPTSKSTLARAEKVYIRICQAAFTTIRPTIGEANRKTDWGAARFDNAIGRYLNHWTDYLSYIILHELIHLLFEYEDEELRRPVWDETFEVEIKKAYRYYGAKALLEQRPSLVDTNVDSLGMIILAIYMTDTYWQDGLAYRDGC